MERETKEISTPSGAKVVVKTYLTGREANAVKEVMYKLMKLDISSGEAAAKEITGEFMLNQEYKLLETLIVSIGGSKEGIMENLLDMRNEDYQAVITEVNKIYQGNLAQAK